VGRLAAQERQHGLVPAVHTIEVADGQGAGGGQRWVVKTAKNLHGDGGALGLDLGCLPFVMELRNQEGIL
jgi:hypothetical protein